MLLAIALVSFICDAIHQLEADKPLLSWLLPTWVKIIHHVRAFEQQHADNDVLQGDDASLVDVVKKRFDTHYDPSWAAAYLVDPMFAKQGEQGWYLFKQRELLSTPKQDDALAFLKILAGPGNAAAVQEEFTRLKLAPLPAAMAKDLPTLVRQTPAAEGGATIVASAEMRRGGGTCTARTFRLLLPPPSSCCRSMSLAALPSAIGRCGAGSAPRPPTGACSSVLQSLLPS
jgi:hypothetical protein